MRKTHLKNISYNIIGALVPIVLVIVTVPRYLEVIGSLRFGILSLIWLLFGYFGLFDFGLSRATANRLAMLRGGNAQDRAVVFYTAVFINLCLGLILGLIFYAFASPILATISGSNPAIQPEIDQCIPWMAGLFPLAMVGGVFTGSLEADERFLQINLQQIVGGALMQCLPLAAVLIYSADLQHAVGGAVGARVFSVAWSAATAVHSYRTRPRFDLEVAKSLLKYGVWVAVTNSISPILESADRFVIGSFLGGNAVTHYSVPFNVAAKALVLPGALSRALFPQFSRLSSQESSNLASFANLIFSAIFAIVCAAAIILAPPALNWWLGVETAKPMIIISQIILLGIWINGVAFIPYALLQAQGRPDVVAKFHAIELLPFLLILVAFVYYGGLLGAAWAWTIRVGIDSILLLSASKVARKSPAFYAMDCAFILAILLLTVFAGIYASLMAFIILTMLTIFRFLRSTEFSGEIQGLTLRFRH